MKVEFTIDAKQVEDEELRQLVWAAWHTAAIRFADIEFERSFRGDQKETPTGLLSSGGNL